MAASNWQGLLAYVMKFSPLSQQGAEQQARSSLSAMA